MSKLSEALKSITVKPAEATPSTSPNYGKNTPFWFWGADRIPVGKPVTATPIVAVTSTTQDKVLKLLNDNPGIAGSTLLNLLKANGFEIIDGTASLKPKEADAAASNVPALRAREAVKFHWKIRESSARDDGIGHTKFKVILIKEGLGNLKDRYYYSKEALESAVPVFEGKKIYADHPTQTEETTRPERSVKDVLGHFEGVKVVTAEDGTTMLEADVVILADKPFEWARGLMRHAVEYSKKYPDKDFVGLSINASGDAAEMPIKALIEAGKIPESALVKVKKAMDEGLESVNLVSNITEAVSCDLVTEAGAGGRIINMIERDLKNAKKTNRV